MRTIDDNKRDEIIARVIDAPDTLTTEDIRLILEDEELNELYRAAVLCKDASVAECVEVPDVEAELARFKAKRNNVRPLSARWNRFMRVVAIFVGVMVSTLVVAAVMEYRGFELFRAVETETLPEEQLPESGSQVAVAVSDTPVTIVNDKELNYDNVSLEDIMSELATIYDVSVTFENDEVKTLRLYMKIEQGKSIGEVVEQLSAFEKFDISVSGNKVTIK